MGRKEDSVFGKDSMFTCFVITKSILKRCQNESDLGQSNHGFFPFRHNWDNSAHFCQQSSPLGASSPIAHLSEPRYFNPAVRFIWRRKSNSISVPSSHAILFPKTHPLAPSLPNAPHLRHFPHSSRRHRRFPLDRRKPIQRRLPASLRSPIPILH